MDDIKKASEQFVILDHSPIGHFILRKDLVVIFWNKCMEDWSGIFRDKIVGTDLATHFSHLEDGKYISRIKGIFQCSAPITFPSQVDKYFIPSPLPGGKYRIQSTFVTSIPAQENGEYYAFFSIQDETNVMAALESNNRALRQLKKEIEVRKQAEGQLVKLARYDNVTGLANRSLLREGLLRALAKTRRNHKTFALMFLDLDHFKDINDTMGHDVGDLLLKSVADRLKRRVRENDLVARMGGDEFAILIDDCTPDNAAHISQSILDALAPFHKLDNNEVFVSSSIGIAMCPDAGEDPETICKSADTAMYLAKKMGRNNFQFFSQKLHEQTMKRIHLENDLRRALDQKEFVLFYQPKVDKGGNVVGMEALIRWQHNTLGMISPSKFIPMAEKTGLITPISEWVLHTACTQISEWQKNHYLSNNAKLAVNVSLRQLKQDSFWDTLQETLSLTQLEPHCLELELSENSIMDNPQATITLLNKIHQMGPFITIDDFGTGYSSLYYLRRLPIDAIKIDMSFVQGIGKDNNDEEIIKVIITLARSLGLKSVAEGVETNEQVNFLHENQCDSLQGFYFCRPLPAEVATHFLKEISSEEKLEESQLLITD
ncbi:periplasmic sensor diguanylate cyclase /phosphodiesterase [Candidatus Scalindua japonica]|uniref:Periplasmic sensor diguanylate cyclase /phosphodiesterase n=1 Tax=Candidatus Scalindua japonica TaxID=1284222 RepID=A0A286U4H6_9BACT|nr:EAL domain-containing protein [Candidatus Scalindua japonica]GAX63058.1 periplasmic sensor diguanylate cyclase /phosphodiesterase [Candidatus Scalindua japonica]